MSVLSVSQFIISSLVLFICSFLCLCVLYIFFCFGLSTSCLHLTHWCIAISTCIHVSLSHTLCRTALVMLVKDTPSYKKGFWTCTSSISRRFTSIPLRSVRDSPPLIPSLTACTSAYSDRLAVVSCWLSSPSKHPCFMSSCSPSRVHAYPMFLHSAMRYITAVCACVID